MDQENEYSDLLYTFDPEEYEPAPPDDYELLLLNIRRMVEKQAALAEQWHEKSGQEWRELEKKNKKGA